MDTEIPKAEHLEQEVFNIHNEKDFSRIALAVYHFQFANNPLYQAYCRSLGRLPGEVTRVSDIPFLPISFFKTHTVTTTAFEPRLVFRSSGTTGEQTSSHVLKDPSIYQESFQKGFELYFGDPASYCVLGLLPSYLERNDSSLVYMVDSLIKLSHHSDSGFYLYDFERLHSTLVKLEGMGQKTILFGVSFALLDFSLQFPVKLRHTSVLETGGMKGRKEELTKNELYAILKNNLGQDVIYSEYGMTEMLSQAYATDGLFTTPPWLRVLLRDETDPLTIYELKKARTGVINVIDLANIYSCSFIATDDLGRFSRDGRFEVLGRLDYSDVRGCSQLVL